MENKPINGREYLVELSKDHHLTLLFCWKIKEGLKQGITTSRLKDYVEFYANTYISSHFIDEEVLLLNRCSNVLCDQAKAEHALILEQISKIKNNKHPENILYEKLTQLLTSHVWFEERRVFPVLENLLPSATLSSVAAFLAKENKTLLKENYRDKFWIKK